MAAVDVTLQDSAGKTYPTQFLVDVKLDNTYWPRTVFVPPTPASITDVENDAPVFVAGNDAPATGSVAVGNPYHDPRYGVRLALAWMRVYNTGTRELHTLTDPTPASPHWPAGLTVDTIKADGETIDAGYTWKYTYMKPEDVGTLVTMGFDITDNLHTYPREYIAVEMYETVPAPQPCTVQEKGDLIATLELGQLVAFTMTAQCPPGTQVNSTGFPTMGGSVRMVDTAIASGSITAQLGLYGNIGAGRSTTQLYTMTDTTGATLERKFTGTLPAEANLPPVFTVTVDGGDVKTSVSGDPIEVKRA
jgi:hypothetical protein